VAKYPSLFHERSPFRKPDGSLSVEHIKLITKEFIYNSKIKEN
jgi:hypothetical protein